MDKKGKAEPRYSYNPKPLDTTDIDMPESLEPLLEKLAEHIHDIWANKRIEEGWKYGPFHNGEEKQNPNLVPYTSLTESEKEYDRQTALEAIKAIIAFGYKIEKR